MARWNGGHRPSKETRTEVHRRTPLSADTPLPKAQLDVEHEGNPQTLVVARRLHLMAFERLRKSRMQDTARPGPARDADRARPSVKGSDAQSRGRHRRAGVVTARSPGVAASNVLAVSRPRPRGSSRQLRPAIVRALLFWAHAVRSFAIGPTPRSRSYQFIAAGVRTLREPCAVHARPNPARAWLRG